MEGYKGMNALEALAAYDRGECTCELSEAGCPVHDPDGELLDGNS